MESMWDIELPCVVNHYQVLTGPIVGGYVIAFLLRGESNAQAIVQQYQCDRGQITVRMHWYIKNPSVDPVVKSQESGDGGVFVSRRSWLDMEFNGSHYYEAVHNIVANWPSAVRDDDPLGPLEIRTYSLVDNHMPARITHLHPRTEIILTSSYANMMRDLKTVFMHKKIYTEIITKMMRYHSDNMWLGSQYVQLPTVNRACTFVTMMMAQHEGFGLINREWKWSPLNDPHALQLTRARIYMRIHKLNGSIGTLPEHLQSPQFPHGYELKIQHKAPPAASFNALAEWKPSVSHVRLQRLGDPKYMKEQDDQSIDDNLSEACPSHCARTETSSVYQFSDSGSRRLGKGKPLPASREIHPLGIRRINTTEGMQRYPVYRHPAADQSPIPRVLTQQEEFYARIGLPNPGLRPSDEFLDVLNIRNLVIDGKLNLSEIMMLQSLEQGVSRHNMMIMRRELCNIQRQLSDLGIQRPNYQNNKGRRLDPPAAITGERTPSFSATGPNALPLGNSRPASIKDGWTEQSPAGNWDQASNKNLWKDKSPDNSWGNPPKGGEQSSSSTKGWDCQPKIEPWNTQADNKSWKDQPADDSEKILAKGGSWDNTIKENTWMNGPAVPLKNSPRPVSADPLVNPPLKGWIDMAPPAHAVEALDNPSKSPRPRLWEGDSKWDAASQSTGKVLSSQGEIPFAKVITTQEKVIEVLASRGLP